MEIRGDPCLSVASKPFRIFKPYHFQSHYFQTQSSLFAVSSALDGGGRLKRGETEEDRRPAELVARILTRPSDDKTMVRGQMASGCEDFEV